MPKTRLARGSRRCGGLLRGFAACLLAAVLPVASLTAQASEPREVDSTEGPACREPSASPSPDSLRAAVIGAVSAEAARGKSTPPGDYVVLNGRGYNYAPPSALPAPPPRPPQR